MRGKCAASYRQAAVETTPAEDYRGGRSDARLSAMAWPLTDAAGAGHRQAIHVLQAREMEGEKGSPNVQSVS
jgi:hypothetical protein